MLILADTAKLLNVYTYSYAKSIESGKVNPLRTHSVQEIYVVVETRVDKTVATSTKQIGQTL